MRSRPIRMRSAKTHVLFAQYLRCSARSDGTKRQYSRDCDERRFDAGQRSGSDGDAGALPFPVRRIGAQRRRFARYPRQRWRGRIRCFAVRRRVRAIPAARADPRRNARAQSVRAAGRPAGEGAAHSRCGTGGTTVVLALSALHPEEVVGIDASADAVEAGRLRALGHGLSPEHARFEHVPAGQRLPFPDGYFDLVTCVSVLEFISTEPARRAFIAELLRVTRSGGHIYLATPSPLRLREYHSRRLLGDWRRLAGYPWSSSAVGLRRLFEGCEVESMAAERLRGYPRWHRIGWAAPVLGGLLPWQRVLAKKR